MKTLSIYLIAALIAVTTMIGSAAQAGAQDTRATVSGTGTGTVTIDLPKGQHVLSVTATGPKQHFYMNVVGGGRGWAGCAAASTYCRVDVLASSDGGLVTLKADAHPAASWTVHYYTTAAQLSTTTTTTTTPVAPVVADPEWTLDVRGRGSVAYLPGTFGAGISVVELTAQNVPRYGSVEVNFEEADGGYGCPWDMTLYSWYGREVALWEVDKDVVCSVTVTAAPQVTWQLSYILVPDNPYNN